MSNTQTTENPSAIEAQAGTQTNVSRPTQTEPRRSAAQAHATSEPVVERKVPLWAKLALLVCVLFFVSLFLAFASSVSSSGGVD